MPPITFPYSPGFADVPDSSLEAENFAMGVHLGRIVENAAMGMVRPEVFSQQYKHGDVVGTPISPVDGYKYSRSELNYMWGIINQSNPATGQPSSARKFRFGQWFVNQSTGAVTVEKWYSENDSSNTEKTNDGMLLVYTIANRRKNSMVMSDVPFYREHPDSDFDLDNPLRETPLRDLNRNAKFAIVNTEAIYCGTYKSLDVVAAPVSPIDGYEYRTEEIIWLWSWVWTTSADEYVAPLTEWGSPATKMHRMDARVDPDGTCHVNIQFYADNGPYDMGDSFGRIAVTAICQRGAAAPAPNPCSLTPPVAIPLGQRVAFLKPLSFLAVPGSWAAVATAFGGSIHVTGSGVFSDAATITFSDFDTSVLPAGAVIDAAYLTGIASYIGDPVPTTCTLPITGAQGNVPILVSDIPTASIGGWMNATVPFVTPDGRLTISCPSLCVYYHDGSATGIGGNAPNDGRLLGSFTALADDFAWVDSDAFSAGEPVRDDLLVQVNKNIRESVCRPEFFDAGNFTNGQTVPLPISEIDGYAYARDEILYLFEMADTGLGTGGMIRLNNWNIWVDQASGAVSVSTQHIRDGGKFVWDNEGTITVKIIAVRSAAQPVVTPTSTDSSAGASDSSSNTIISNGNMDSWSGTAQQLADGWFATDLLGTYAFSQQPGISPIGSSQGITVDASSGNSAGIRTARFVVYKHDRWVIAYKARSSVTIASGFIVRLRFWNADATLSIYADLYSGGLDTVGVNVREAIEIPGIGDTTMWTSLGIVSLSAAPSWEVAWVDIEFLVEAPSADCTVSIDDVDWYRSEVISAGSNFQHTEPICWDGEVLIFNGDVVMIGVDY